MARGHGLTTAGLATVSVAAWAAVILMGDAMPMDAALWLVAWTTMMAAPLLIFLMLMQKQFVRGLTAGALKDA